MPGSAAILLACARVSSPRCSWPSPSRARPQRWGVGQARPDGWKLFFKGGWAGATGRVNHQVAFVERYGERVSLAIFTEHSPSHGYGSRTLEGVAKRVLEGLPKFEPEP